MKFSKILINILFIVPIASVLLFCGCSSSGVKPIKFNNGKPIYTGKNVTPSPSFHSETNNITLTNRAVFIKPQQITKVEVPITSNEIPSKIIIEIVDKGSTNYIDITDTRPIVSNSPLLNIKNLFVYYFLLILAVLVGWFLWNNRKNKQNISSKIKLE